jgi:CO/xanthine dehydrogenase FAD-binding subunit
MKPPSFRYERAQSVADAVDFLATEGDKTKVLAGGQSLVALMNLRLARPEILLDIGPLDELRYTRQRNGVVEVGALTTQAALEGDAELGARCPLLAESVPYIGHRAIRTRGTIGGAIAHADPAAELPVVLVATNGSVVLTSRSGERQVGADEFFKGFLTTAADPGELLTAVNFPIQSRDSSVAFEEFARRRGDFALVSVACVVERDGEAITRARIVLGGVGSRPQVVDATDSLTGVTGGEAAKVAGELAASSITPVPDIHGTEAYRKHLTRELVERAMRRAAGGVQAELSGQP